MTDGAFCAILYTTKGKGHFQPEKICYDPEHWKQMAFWEP